MLVKNFFLAKTQTSRAAFDVRRIFLLTTFVIARFAPNKKLSKSI